MSVRSARVTTPAGRSARLFLLALSALVALGVLPATASAHIYWTHYSEETGGAIGRVNRDGTNFDPNFITGIGTSSNRPSGIAVDAAHIYWANGDSIGRANLDGTGVDQSFISAPKVEGVAVSGNHIYWSSLYASAYDTYHGGGSIGRANLDGSDVVGELVSFPGPPPHLDPPYTPRGIAADAGHIYWTSVGPGRHTDPSTIGRANLDGYWIDWELVKGAYDRPYSVAVDAVHIYWLNSGPIDFPALTIGRANLDGTGAQTLIDDISGAEWGGGVAVDAAHIYWSQCSPGTYAIARANLDGTDVDESFIPTGDCGSAIAVDPDTNPPDTTIDSGPNGLTNDNTPTFTFSSSEARSTFECKVDGGPFEACSGSGGSHTTFGLANGPHKFQVRAIDEASNVDQSPATRTFTVDANPPETTIYSGPTGLTNDNTPTFTFSSSEAGASFACFDEFVFGTCSGPGASHTIATLPDGPHRFAVTAIDSAGNSDPTLATRDFTVDTTAPDTTITKQPKSRIKTEEKSVTVTVSFESEQGAKLECRLDKAEFEPCSSPYSAEPKSRPGEGKEHRISIRATDQAGNVGKPATVEFDVVRKGRRSQ